MIPGYETPKLTLCGLSTQARVVDVVDGDSLTVVVPCFGTFYKFSLRIDGIDACELRSTHEKNKILAMSAKAAVFHMITGQVTDIDNLKIRDFLQKNYTVVYLTCKDFDKYGRLLAQVKTSFGDDVACRLITEKLVTAYCGGKKLSEEEQLVALGC